MDPLELPGLRALGAEMARYGHEREAPARAVMGMLGDRWTTLILLVLGECELRHADLKRVIAQLSHEQAISQRVLTLKLRALERDGFVLRSVSADVPPKVAYRLSALGEDLFARARGMIDWINARSDAIHEARDRYDRENGAD
ncbi:helix-turn-helix domain-containing protein [Novosphingobium sp. BL-8A]|uniref:winged helix-turn-helix transcriptional regulator n=1 Tax=Novosphingobium sp. BL-8A TaxID=3127639 RepID=UPI00375767C8